MRAHLLTILAVAGAAGLIAISPVSSPAKESGKIAPVVRKSKPARHHHVSGARKLTRRAENFFLGTPATITEKEARSLLKKAAKLGDKLAVSDLKALDRYDAMQANPLVRTTESIWDGCVTNHLRYGHGHDVAAVKRVCQDDMHSCGWPIITSDAAIRSAAMLGVNIADTLTLEAVQSLDACMTQQTESDLTAGYR
jgi:hypothetical protein